MELLIAALIPTFGTILSGLASWAMIELSKYIRTKTKNEMVTGAVEVLTSTTSNVVHDLQQSVVEGMKAASADGKLSKEDMVMIKDNALAKVKAQIPAEVAKTATKAMVSIDDFVKG